MKRLSLLTLPVVFSICVWGQTPSPNDAQSGIGSSAQSGATKQATAGSRQSTVAQTQGNVSQDNAGSSQPVATGTENLKGCLESKDGTYALREDDGKSVVLTGAADMSQYANHEVVIHGDWSKQRAASDASTSDMSKSTDRQFTVNKIDSVADRCKNAKKSDKATGTTVDPSEQH